MNEKSFIQLSDLCKSYGGVDALRHLTLDIAVGEVHAICGENGAGKSTLIKMLSGVVAQDQGEIHVLGHPLKTGSVERAEAVGIAVMHQESATFPDLNAVDNIFVGREMTRCRGLLLDRSRMKGCTKDLLDRLNASIDLDLPVGELPLAQQQMVSLARALSRNCRLLIMDEPTASLSARETRTLLNVVRQLSSEGVSVLYVSHRLEEVFEIADRVSVLRDGQLVATHHVGELNVERVIQLMVGRKIDALETRARIPQEVNNVVLQVEGLTRQRRFHDISFSVHRGEIVGLAGLVGAGRSEIARAIFGIDRYDSGTVRVEGSSLEAYSVQASMSVGIALVPEDRQHEGLVLAMTVAENLSLAMLPSLVRWGFVNRSLESELVQRQMSSLSIKAAGPHVAAETLSGGNQQKIVLGKWLASQPRVLILDEPTRGVDVGAKSQVHQLVQRLAQGGLATLIISSEMQELFSLCDRLLVLREGRIVGEVSCETATQDEVLAMALPDAYKELSA